MTPSWTLTTASRTRFRPGPPTPRRTCSPARAREAGLASVYQDVSLVPLLTIAQNLRLTGTTMEAIRPWLAELELEDVDLTEYARDLPTPTLHLLDLAQALASLPRVLILD